MTIQTKYDLGTEIWFMSRNKPMPLKVESIHTHSSADGTISVQYICGDSTNATSGFSVKESDCYLTKEDLLASL